MHTTLRTYLCHNCHTNNDIPLNNMVGILPPVSKSELDKEIGIMLGRFKGAEEVSGEEFVGE